MAPKPALTLSGPKALPLNGRRALVTGASSGIGEGIASELARSGAEVALHHGPGHVLDAEALAQRIVSGGGRAHLIEGDFAAPKGAANVAAAAIAAMDGVDILVSNVAVQLPQPWEEIDRESFDLQAHVNLLSPIELIQGAMPHMSRSKWGRILCIGSVQEALPLEEMLLYGALKAAQTHMIRNLARRYAAQGVTVNGLSPGPIDTPRLRDRMTTSERRADVIRAIPAARIGAPADCAGLAAFLCSDAASYITGQIIGVDGGMSA